MIIHEDGVVVTNYHVVDLEKGELLYLNVMTHSGDTYIVDEILATDKLHDIAILKLKMQMD